MIHLQRTRDASSLSGFTGQKLKAKLERLLNYYYDGNGTVDLKPKARQVWGKAKEQLRFESSGKCAYCEADTTVVAHGDVEHFRPKSEYWWLAYCYDNYTFSCQICNQTYKGNQFPIEGEKLPQPKVPRAFPTNLDRQKALISSLCPDPANATDAAIATLLSVEDAHLPNPYVQDPEQLFAWKANPDTKEVSIIAKGRSTRAKRALKAVENVLGLNRTELLRLRWNHYDELETLALALQEGSFPDKKKLEILKRIRDQAGSDRPFSAMKRFYLKAWGFLKS